MLKKTALFAFLVCGLFACGNDATTTDTAQANTQQTTTPTAKTAGEIKANPPGIDEGDLFARLDNSVTKLATEFKTAAKAMPDFSNPSLKLEDKTKLVFAYTEKGVNYERRLDLNDLGSDTGSLRVEGEDGQSIKFPSLIVRTKSGEPVIKVLKDGKEVQKDNEFRVTLADRKSIERAAPLMVQIINLAHQIAAK